MFSVYFNSELMFLVFFGDSVVLLFKQFSWFVDDFSTGCGSITQGPDEVKTLSDFRCQRVVVV